MFSSTSFAEWTKVSESVNGYTWYVDFERIKKHDGYVYYWYLTDYLKPSPQGLFSNKSYLKGDCKLVRTKTLTEHYFTGQMGGGYPKVWELTKFQKKWMYPTPDSAGETILKSVCQYAR